MCTFVYPPHFHTTDAVKKVFNQTASALAAITVLKKVGGCTMPSGRMAKPSSGVKRCTPLEVTFHVMPRYPSLATQVCDHPALLSERAAQGIISGASRARRQAAARLGGNSLSGSDVEEIEDSSEEEILESEEGEWESGG